MAVETQYITIAHLLIVIFFCSLDQVYVSILETRIVYSPFGTGTCGVSGLQVVDNFITFRIIAQILMLKINNLLTPLNNEYISKVILDYCFFNNIYKDISLSKSTYS